LAREILLFDVFAARPFPAADGDEQHIEECHQHQSKAIDYLTDKALCICVFG